MTNFVVSLSIEFSVRNIENLLLYLTGQEEKKKFTELDHPFFREEGWEHFLAGRTIGTHSSFLPNRNEKMLNIFAECRNEKLIHAFFDLLQHWASYDTDKGYIGYYHLSDDPVLIYIEEGRFSFVQPKIMERIDNLTESE